MHKYWHGNRDISLIEVDEKYESCCYVCGRTEYDVFLNLNVELYSIFIVQLGVHVCVLCAQLCKSASV